MAAITVRLLAWPCRAADRLPTPQRFCQFDVTKLARTLHAANQLTAGPTVTIAPAGAPAEKANPVIGEIYLIEE